MSMAGGVAGLMALAGGFLLRWGWLEDQLKNEPVPLELEHIRLMRNVLSHRLSEAHSDPVTGVSYIVCRTRAGARVMFCSEELQQATDDLDRGLIARRAAAAAPG